MPGFDAVKEATKIEHLVKDYMSHQNDKTTPEASRQTMNADRHELEKEMTDIWKTKAKLDKVAVELEKMTNETWSKQPNVSFDHDKEGNVTSMTFSPSRWTSEGLTSSGRDDHKVVVSFDKDKHQANLYETVRTVSKDPG